MYHTCTCTIHIPHTCTVYVCICTIHTCTYTHVQYTCICTIHMYMYYTHVPLLPFQCFHFHLLYYKDKETLSQSVMLIKDYHDNDNNTNTTMEPLLDNGTYSLFQVERTQNFRTELEV